MNAAQIMSNDTGALSIVAIPACNESERVVACLQALEDQTGVRRSDLGVLLFLNNCTDDTRRLVEDWSARSSLSSIRIEECDDDGASAGWARRRAMELAAAWLDELHADNGILLTTDADSRVPKDWIARNRAELTAGADAVAGRVAFDPADIAAFPASLRRRQRDEHDYEMLLAEIKARFDPVRGDPWPCHMTNSGASIAVSLAAFRCVGGVPSVVGGEDRAFIERLRAGGFVVRHAPEIVVTTSGRLDGRAKGGTATTLGRQLTDIDSPCDVRLERLTMFVFRLLGRRLFAALGIVTSDQLLARRPLRPRELPKQIRRARWLLKALRWLATRRDDSPPSPSDLLRHESKQLSTP